MARKVPGFCLTLLNTLKNMAHTCPVMISSSIHRHRQDNLLQSRRRCQSNCCSIHAKETGAKVLVYRFPLSARCRPNYNSVKVITAITSPTTQADYGERCVGGAAPVHISTTWWMKLIGAAFTGDEMGGQFSLRSHIAPDYAGRHRRSAAFIQGTETLEVPDTTKDDDG